MNIMKKWRSFWTLKPGRSGGFTLVELIVVIAILGILAGVGTVAYNGYVVKANKQADISLASDVAKALQLAYYADPQASYTGSVILSEDGAIVADDDAFAEAAMEDAFGDNWQTVAKLKYDKWGNGAAVTQEVIEYFMTVTDPDDPLYDIFNGNADISYTDNIPELFDLMEDTAILIAGKRTSLGSGASMVSDAATITMNKNAEDFSELWASSAWDSSFLMGGDGSDYNANAGQLTDDKLKNAIANAGVIKARNVALATYLSDLGYDDAADAISNYTYADSVVPDDAAAIIMKELNGDTVTDPEEQAFLDTVFAGADVRALGGAIVAYYDESTGNSQAYTDGLAYYAMMSTVDYLGSEDVEEKGILDKTNDETWWNDLYSAVDMYSSVANGEASLADLNNLYSNMGNVSGNTVLVMLMVQNGVPSVMISPVDANP